MKLLIIGIVASGKTTLAKNISNKLNICYYELDSIVHDDINNIKRNNKEQREILNKILEKKDFIIEGTLRRNLYFLLLEVDEIVYLDIPLRVRYVRIFLRYIKQKLKIEKSNYTPSFQMLKSMYKWTNDFERDKSKLLNVLEKYKDKLTILKNSKEIKEYIKNL